MTSATEKYFSCNEKPFQIMDTNLNKTYSGTVGVQNKTEHEKKIYILIFLGQKQIILFTT